MNYLKPTAIKNIGNSCYLSSCLQMIFNELHLVKSLFLKKEFTKKVQKNKELITKILSFKKECQKYLFSQNNIYYPKQFFINILHSDFKLNRQHDANECLLDILNIICDTLGNDNLNIDLLEINCKTNKAIPTKELMLFLNIPKNKENVSLKDCLFQYLQPTDNIDIDRKTRYFIKKTNQFLIFSLNRFEIKNNQWNKNNKNIIIPPEITIDNQHYKIKSCIIHLGGMKQNGHYIALVYRVNKWFLCDDHNIIHISDPKKIHQLLNQSYIILYKNNNK